MASRPLAILAAALALTACGDPGTGTGPDPDPGPHFTVSPIELDKLARVTPIGTNGKVLPIGHTYWYTCDTEYLLPVDRPCVRERLPIRAPTDGVVFSVEPEADGGVSIEGPPGVYAGFGHVTPVPGLRRGDRVRAGDTIATMYTDFAIDFGVIDTHAPEHAFLRRERHQEGYLHAQSPIAQYSGTLRSELIARVNTREDPLGRLVYDVAGTAAGGWWLEGTPLELSGTPAYESAGLFLGRLQERGEIRIVSTVAWFRALLDLAVVDPAAPDWEDITPASGIVQLKLWEIARDGDPRPDAPRGSVLVQVLAGERIRAEWVDTHAEVSGFTGAARVYER